MIKSEEEQIVWVWKHQELEVYTCHHLLSPNPWREPYDEHWEDGPTILDLAKEQKGFLVCPECCMTKVGMMGDGPDAVYDQGLSSARWAVVTRETGEILFKGDQVLDPERVRFLVQKLPQMQSDVY